MAPYIPPPLLSKKDLVHFVINVIARRVFEDNVERGTLNVSPLANKVHVALCKRYGVPYVPPPTEVPARIKALNDPEVLAHWKVMQPDPVRLREWYVRDAERMLQEEEDRLDRLYDRGQRVVDYEALRYDLDHEIGQAKYEEDAAAYHRFRYDDVDDEPERARYRDERDDDFQFETELFDLEDY